MGVKSEVSEDVIKSRCDLVVERAAHAMQSELSAPVGMIIDRMVTYSVAQMVADIGAANAAAVLRSVADQVLNGAFATVIPETLRN